jgi:hypothetical protein
MDLAGLLLEKAARGEAGVCIQHNLSYRSGGILLPKQLLGSGV